MKQVYLDLKIPTTMSLLFFSSLTIKKDILMPLIWLSIVYLADIQFLNELGRLKKLVLYDLKVALYIWLLIQFLKFYFSKGK